MEKIYIVLINYNRYKDTIECINSIKKNEKGIEYEIVVVDNKSTNESVEKLKQIQDIHLILSENNKGFSYGNNLGIKYAIENGANYILLLNNDTIIEKNSISILYNEMTKHEDVGIMSARVMYYDAPDRINCIGGHIDWYKGIAVLKNWNTVYEPSNKKFDYTQFITGCCMLIKKDVIDKVGYLPEEYFMYFEDVDYCVDIQNHGYKIGVCYDSIIYHKESASSGGSESSFTIKWNTRNRIIFMYKYECKGIITKIFFYSTRVIVGMKYLLKGEKEKYKALRDGIIDGMKWLGGKRKNEERHSAKNRN